MQRRADGSPWVLGAGGMGLTYRALDTRLRTEVALKVIHPARLGDRQTQLLFLREARAAARVQHPNVAAVTFLEDSGTLFYAMEFVDGVTLHGWLRRQRRLAAVQALAFAEQIAQGLAAIHEQGLIHRDLKPPNIMVLAHPAGSTRADALRAAGGCQLKIIDFGLARATEPGPLAPDDDAPLPTTGFRGTAAYASPEQCDERTDLDARSDLYALGCILWELLAGQPPFVARSHRELVEMQIQSAPPWSALPDCPAPVREVLASLLAKSRVDRPRDATAAAAALAAARLRLSDSTTPLAAPPTPATAPVPLTAPASRAESASPTVGTRITIELPARWWTSAGALAAGIVLALAGAGLVRFVLQRPPPAAATSTPAPAAPPTVPPATAELPTVAVLRFTHLGSDAGGEQFARGVGEDLLSSLHKVRGLRIVSLGSSAVPEDRARLGLTGPRTAFLEGSVRREGRKVRISARLVEAAGGVQLWSETYQSELADAFEVQQSVAQEIARALAANLTEAERQTLGRRPTRSAEAAELLANARALWHGGGRTLAVNEEILQLLRRATTLDPEYALAWAYLARTHNVMYFHALDRSPERLAQAKEAAEKALRLQPDLPEAHIAFARTQWFSDPQPQLLLRAYRQVLVLAPGNPEALESLADIHLQLLQPEESLAVSREAASRTPDDAGKAANVGYRLTLLRRYAEAEEWFQRAADLSQGAPLRVLRYERCVAERTGDWRRYLERARPLIAKLPPEARWVEQLQVRDFRGALATVAALPGNELALHWQRIPKTLVTSQLRRWLGDAEGAAADARQALAAMQASTGARTVEAGWQIKLALAQARAGLRGEALTTAEAALRAAPTERGAIVTMQVLDEMAQLCAEVGEPARGVQMLQELLKMPWWGSRVLVQHSPLYDGLREHPSFAALVEARM
ncbi:MAG: protein kinase [Verrucomicrobia bacterium]|nr:protein kinase [Verrucomicrobiota bacterium]